MMSLAESVKLRFNGEKWMRGIIFFLFLCNFCNVAGAWRSTMYGLFFHMVIRVSPCTVLAANYRLNLIMHFTANILLALCAFGMGLKTGRNLFKSGGRLLAVASTGTLLCVSVVYGVGVQRASDILTVCYGLCAWVTVRQLCLLYGRRHIWLWARVGMFIYVVSCVSVQCIQRIMQAKYAYLTASWIPWNPGVSGYALLAAWIVLLRTRDKLWNLLIYVLSIIVVVSCGERAIFCLFCLVSVYMLYVLMKGRSICKTLAGTVVGIGALYVTSQINPRIGCFTRLWRHPSAIIEAYKKDRIICLGIKRDKSSNIWWTSHCFYYDLFVLKMPLYGRFCLIGSFLVFLVLMGYSGWHTSSMNRHLWVLLTIVFFIEAVVMSRPFYYWFPTVLALLRKDGDCLNGEQNRDLHQSHVEWAVT